MAAFLAAIIGGFNQVRGAILGGVILGILDNLSAGIYLIAISRRLSLAHPHRCHSATSARAAGPHRGTHGMNRPGAIAVGVAATFTVAIPFFLKPFGIYLISLWAVLTIAAIGLNLTLGYADRFRWRRAPLLEIGAYTVALILKRAGHTQLRS